MEATFSIMIYDVYVSLIISLVGQDVVHIKLPNYKILHGIRVIDYWFDLHSSVHTLSMCD